MSSQSREAAVVTGAASGIGAACARMLRQNGYSVASLDKRKSRDADLSIKLDVRDSGAVDDAFTTCENSLGPVTALVTAAGYYERIPFLELTPHQWQQIYDVLVGGTLNCIYSAASRMSKRRAGAICTIGSELALCGAPDSVHYATAKGAVHGMSAALAAELGLAGIRLTCIAPGPTDTPLMTTEMRDPAYIESLPLKRLVSPEEIAAAVRLAIGGRLLHGRIISPNAGAVI